MTYWIRRWRLVRFRGHWAAFAKGVFMIAGLRSPLKSGASVFALVVMTSPVLGHGLPGRGHFADGQGHISRDGGQLTVDQDSRTAIIDWKGFSVGKANSVVFDNGRGATLNIVHGGNMSRIAGDLHATGSVYLINRAGVVVTGAGHVDTQGSFMASGRGADADSFGGNGRHLQLTGASKGSIINRGVIDAGRNVSLSGRTISSSGTLSANSASLIAKGRMVIGGSIAANGRVETSGGNVRFANGRVTASRWLVDPTNLKVTASAASTISNSLSAGTDVALHTTASGATGPGHKTSGDGDITVAAPISWTGNATLTLDAYNDVNINKSIEVHDKGGLDIISGDGSVGGAYSLGANGIVTFDTLQASLNINGNDYMLVNSVHGLANAANANTGGYFAFAQDYDASGDGTYHHAPVPVFKGTFDGLGHTISHFTIHNEGDKGLALFGFVHNGMLRDITLADADVSGGSPYITAVGTLVGQAILGTTILNAHSSGRVSANVLPVGGLAGTTNGLVADSSSSATVIGTGGNYVGGLVGQSQGEILNSHASGNVRGGFAVGGLVGGAETGGIFDVMIKNSYATGNISDANYGGGLVGASFGNGKTIVPIEDSYATGNVNALGAGGLMGASFGILIRCFATGDVTAAGGEFTDVVAGGLVGEDRGRIYDSYATGSVTASSFTEEDTNYAGGLVGELVNFGTSGNGSGGLIRAITMRSYATGAVTGDDHTIIGGLIGASDNSEPGPGKLANNYWDMTTTGITDPSQGIGNIANANGITGLTDSQLKSGLPDGFSAAVWAQSNGINDGLPYLSGNPPP